jgi:hypothetical protein
VKKPQTLRRSGAANRSLSIGRVKGLGSREREREREREVAGAELRFLGFSLSSFIYSDPMWQRKMLISAASLMGHRNALKADEFLRFLVGPSCQYSTAWRHGKQ